MAVCLSFIFCVSTYILVVWLPIISLAMNEYEGLLLNQSSIISCQDKYGSTHEKQTYCLKALPMDCWAECSEYISSPRTSVSFRRLSSSHLQLYEDAMERRARRYKRLLLDSVVGREPESVARIIQSTILIPGGYLDLNRHLNHNDLIPYFCCIDRQSSKHMIAGIDSSSGHPFLFIVLRHDDNANHHLLLMLMFGSDRFVKVHGFIDFEALEDPYIAIDICMFNVDNLIELLQDEYIESSSFRRDIIWTMESRSKQFQRRIRRKCIGCCKVKRCGKQVAFCSFLFIIITIYWILFYVLPHKKLHFP